MSKIAAIWARVSTEGQAETSLPSQIARVTEKLEAAGYTVPPDRVLSVSWSSLDLFRCPQFLQLAGWVRNKEIQAVGMLDRDRLHSDPPHERLAFLSECKQSGVEVILCQGPPMLEGDYGDLMEHIHTIAKKQQVLRAKLGAKDGIRDRIVRHRKPASRHRVYGYTWKNYRLLVPDDNYDTVVLILDLALKGTPYRRITKELEIRGLLSPTGNSKWGVGTISWIVRNPIYGGRYYALGMQVCEPQKRRGNTSGNSSARSLPLEQREYLPEVEIKNPPITWEQFLQLQERVKRNKELAKRNNKRYYLLRGFIYCETHYGTNGKPRVYCGKPHHDSYIYRCPVGGCAHPTLNGPQIEEMVKSHTWWLLNLQPEEFYRQIGDQSNVEKTKESLEKELRSLEIKRNRNINVETELENRDLLGQVHPEVYRRLKSGYQAERLWIEERTQAIENQLEQLSQQDKVVEAWRDIKKRLRDRIGVYIKDSKFDDYLTNAEWQELFKTLNLEVQVRDKDNPTTWAKDWRIKQNGRLVDGDGQPVDQCIPEQGDIEICFGISPKIETERVERIADIVFKTP